MWNILLGILAGAAVAGTIYACVRIYGMITKKKIKKTMRSKGIEDAFIKKIDWCRNVVQIEDMGSDRVVELRGDDVDYELDEGDLIYV